jgi:hypothetical protein
MLVVHSVDAEQPSDRRKNSIDVFRLAQEGINTVTNAKLKREACDEGWWREQTSATGLGIAYLALNTTKDALLITL